MPRKKQEPKSKADSFKSPTSSNVVGAKYNYKTQELVIDFKSGSYKYSDFPEHGWESFKEATSKGSYVSQWVKPYFKGVKV